MPHGAVVVIDAAGDPLVIADGTDVTITFTLDLNGALTGDNLVGATITGRIRDANGSRQLLAPKALSLVSNVAKTVTLTLTAADTDGWPDGDVLADIKVVLGGGTVRKHGPYTFSVRRSITG